ncbi:alpha/beta fold hydrolase [Streptomyces aureocirculatus]|uniref:alpha/beta fold hydrolase n=1 Tax=Streptomyces aureocirculatus TaxID=67275 RepID=UPI00068BF71D|nr:alpha/beta hydrolase [Streptomyces aureocirculatus]
MTGDGPVCVLSAGLGLAWFEWDPVVALLARSRTVVRFDRPGLGLSGPAREAPTLVGEAERIGRVLDALGFGEDAVTVVGHSLAGFHAEAFARLCPRRTAGLVLVDSSVEEGAGAGDVPGRGVRPALARGAGAVLGGLGVPRAVGPSARRLAGGRSAPPPARELCAVYGSGRVWRAALMEYLTYGDVARELGAMRRGAPLPGGAPVTVLAASPKASGTDAWVGRQHALAHTLRADFRVLAPAGHLLMRARPHEVTEAILRAH